MKEKEKQKQREKERPKEKEREKQHHEQRESAERSSPSKQNSRFMFVVEKIKVTHISYIIYHCKTKCMNLFIKQPIIGPFISSYKRFTNKFPSDSNDLILPLPF